MRLRNILKTCLAFRKSEPQYAYKRYAYKKHIVTFKACIQETFSHTKLKNHLP